MDLTLAACQLALNNLRAKEDALSEAMGEVERRIAQLSRHATDDTLADLQRERAVIAKVLMTFYCSPVSMSSIQPLLELAEALNPAMVKVPRAWRPFVADQP